MKQRALLYQSKNIWLRFICLFVGKRNNQIALKGKKKQTQKKTKEKSQKARKLSRAKNSFGFGNACEIHGGQIHHSQLRFSLTL